MLGRLLLFMMMVPFVELFLMIQAHRYWSMLWGSQNAWMTTLGLIFLSALAGVTLAKKQGLRLFSQAQTQMRQGRLPSETMLEGLLMLAGATALIIPGYLTDFVGILLLIPWTRSMLMKKLKVWLGQQVANGRVTVHQAGHYSQHDALTHRTGSVDIIDVEPIQKP
ncbi:MAG TPA: FxsA family protein [Oligoflexus sp.]|uniref:FxsA family protein n=1 Tax=Oligoflexus sp. TaxID=1971216 RepID=UPI002D298E6B|nr:FxsA family protein [Oligoflexus sp.]HYX36173.1 FxsA family protein [Oligoflexus sp.]